ncbi:hypothetical protein D3C73_949460 [compost metagenome]
MTLGRPQAADADDALDPKVIHQLVGVEHHGGDPHAVAHHRDALALVVAGVTQHVAHIGHLARIGQKGLGDIAGPQRIPRHDDGLGEIARVGIDMSGHCCRAPD